MTYLTHLPVLLPVVSALRLGEDNNRCNRIVANGGCLRGEALDNSDPGQWTMALILPSIGRNGGHNGAVVVHGVDLWCGVPPEVLRPNAVLHMPPSQGGARSLGRGAAATAALPSSSCGKVRQSSETHYQFFELYSPPHILVIVPFTRPLSIVAQDSSPCFSRQQRRILINDMVYFPYALE